MKNVLILSLVLGLGGCATVSAIVGTTITQNQVDAARSGYDGGFLAGLHRYALLPKCKTGQTFVSNQCHDATALRNLRTVDSVVGADFNTVQTNLNAGDNSALLNSWSILTNAINQANATLASAQQ